jgi:hypothetical protein
MSEITSRPSLAAPFFGLAVLMFVASFYLVMEYAGPEPFSEYHRADALLFVAGGAAAIAFWLGWSLGLVWAVLLRALKPWALCGLLVPVVPIFYLQFCVPGLPRRSRGSGRSAHDDLIRPN